MRAVRVHFELLQRLVEQRDQSDGADRDADHNVYEARRERVLEAHVRVVQQLLVCRFSFD